MTAAEVEQTGAQETETPPVASPSTPAVAEPDLSTPKGIRDFLAQHPASQAVLADERNAERQRVQAEIRRERGSDESIRAYHESLLKEAQRRMENGESFDGMGKDTPLFVRANREAVEASLFQALYEQAKELDPDAVASLEGFATSEGLTAENWKALSQAAMNAVVSSSKKSALAEFLDSEDDLPSDSKRIKAIEARLKKEYEMELAARETESKPKLPQPPATPTGVSAEGVTKASVEAMSPEALADAASNDEFRRQAIDALFA